VLSSRAECAVSVASSGGEAAGRAGSTLGSTWRRVGFKTLLPQSALIEFGIASSSPKECPQFLYPPLSSLTHPRQKYSIRVHTRCTHQNSPGRRYRWGRSHTESLLGQGLLFHWGKRCRQLILEVGQESIQQQILHHEQISKRVIHTYGS